MTVTSQAVRVLNHRFSHWRAEQSNFTCTVWPASTAYRSMLAFISCRHRLCGLLSSVFTIRNADALRRLYAVSPVLCNLSGHIHLQHMGQTDSGLWDIATSSLAVSPNQYGVLTLTEDALTYRTAPVRVSDWAAAQGLSDPNLLDFAAYSADFFRACCLRQALAAIAGDDAPEQLADFFAAANAAYFSGRMDTLARDSALEKRWQAQSGFLPLYLADILSQPPVNQCELTLSL